MKPVSVVALAVMLLVVPTAAVSFPLTYIFASSLPVDPGGAASGSTSADVILEFDSTTPDLDPSATIGQYAVQSARVEFSNGHVSAVASAPDLVIRVGSGWEWGGFGFFYQAGAFPFASETDLLVTSGSGPVVSWAVSYVFTDPVSVVAAFPTSLTIVPEPAAAGLLALAGLALARRGTALPGAATRGARTT